MFRLRKEVYLDNNSTTKITKNVYNRINYVLKNCYGNPSSIYKVSHNSAIVLEESRALVAKAINAEPHEIYFTGSATEANNNILKAVVELSGSTKNKIISTPIEHQSVISSLKYLNNRGIDIEYMPVDNKGRVLINKLEGIIDSRTILVCCMIANNEIGTIQDIKKIVAISKKNNVLVMSDSVQALGKMNFDVKYLGINYASFSAHKIHGPKGVGAVFVKEGSPFQPFIHGGHQESGMRAGTEGLHNIAGFAEACKDIKKNLSKAEQIFALKTKFISELKIIKSDIKINSSEIFCLPNTVNITFPGVDNSIFMAFLDYNGIEVSTGSACNTQSNEPSHVLTAIGLSEKEARESIRFSLSENIPLRDIEYVLKVIREFFEDKSPPISLLNPKQLNENLIFNDQSYILDVRNWDDRKILRALPNSYEASFFHIKQYLHQIPKSKNIIIVCQYGFNSPFVAYYLVSKGFKNVSILLTGLIGWKLYYPQIYNKFAGKNITRLKKEV